MESQQDRAGPNLTDVSGRVLVVLLVAIIPIAFVSMAAHDFALVKLHVPYPDEGSLPQVNRWLGQVVRIAGLYVLCRYAGAFLLGRSTVVACLIMGLVNAALGESLRVLVIQTEVLGGSTSDLLFSTFDRAPIIALSFYQGVVAALIARTSSRATSATALLAIPLAAALGLYGLQPALQALCTAAETWLHLGSPQPKYLPPYGLHIYKYIYPTFLEPALASLFLASVVWPGLSPDPLRRIGLYTALLLVARGRMFAELVNSFWLKVPPPMSFAAEGQFFVETLLLASLTGLLWEIATRKVVSRSEAIGRVEPG